MTCEYCDMGDEGSAFPMYGVGPHRHQGVTGELGSWIGSTVMLEKSNWPENYREDPDVPGLGIWWCPQCGEGKSEDDQPTLGELALSDPKNFGEYA